VTSDVPLLSPSRARGPDILIAALTQKKGSKTALADGDLRLADDRRAVVDRAVREFGGVAILESYRGRKCKAA
jgi:hypothetical protein